MDPVRPAWPQSAEQERALVDRMRAGDEDAFEAFAKSYLPGLYRFARRRLEGDRDLSQEIVQATVCKVFENLGSFRGEAALFTWLCACCKNEIALHHRRRARRPGEADGYGGFEDDAEAFPDPAPAASPEHRLRQSETAQLVHAALDLLPPAWARAVEWRYLEGLAVPEIAARLEVSYKAAESLLSRGRSAFREVYERLTEGRPERAAPAARPKESVAP